MTAQAEGFRVSGGVITGGLSAFLAFWIFMSALEGLGYAFPVRPSVIVPERWASGAQVLFWTIIGGLIASIALPLLVGSKPSVTVFHFLIVLGIVLPIWEIVAARVYDDCFVIINAHESVIRPIVVASLGRVFGEVYEDKDMIRAAYKVGEDWQIITHEHEHLLALDPVFKVDMHRRIALEHDIQKALHDVESAGFNERSFWISFVTPLGFALAYAAIAFYLLKLAAMQPPH
jgi:hypothetical protein